LRKKKNYIIIILFLYMLQVASAVVYTQKCPNFASCIRLVWSSWLLQYTKIEWWYVVCTRW